MLTLTMLVNMAINYVDNVSFIQILFCQGWWCSSAINNKPIGTANKAENQQYERQKFHVICFQKFKK